MSEARSSPATAFPSPAFEWRSHPHSGWTWGGTGWGVDKGRSQSPPQRCPPPTWGGTGWGVDKGRSQSPPQRCPPPTWGGTGWGVDKGRSQSPPPRCPPPAGGGTGWGVDKGAGDEEGDRGRGDARGLGLGRPRGRPRRGRPPGVRHRSGGRRGARPGGGAGRGGGPPPRSALVTAAGESPLSGARIEGKALAVRFEAPAAGNAALVLEGPARPILLPPAQFEA